MDSLLQEINMLPGVLGCFVYNNKQQIAGSRMPPIFKQNTIQSIGNLISRTVQMGNMAGLNFIDLEFKYNESLLLINPLSDGSLLVIICEPATNKSLVNMTTGMLAKDIEASLATGVLSTAVPSGKTPPVKNSPAPPPPKQPAPAKEAEISAELAPVLEQVKDALALAIGPIAAPVMKDSIELWAKEKEPVIANLPALAKILCEEINDPNLEDEFMTELRKINT